MPYEAIDHAQVRIQFNPCNPSAVSRLCCVLKTNGVKANIIETLRSTIGLEDAIDRLIMTLVVDGNTGALKDVENIGEQFTESYKAEYIEYKRKYDPFDPAHVKRYLEQLLEHVFGPNPKNWKVEDPVNTGSLEVGRSGIDIVFSGNDKDFEAGIVASWLQTLNFKASDVGSRVKINLQPDDVAKFNMTIFDEHKQGLTDFFRKFSNAKNNLDGCLRPMAPVSFSYSRQAIYVVFCGNEQRVKTLILRNALEQQEIPFLVGGGQVGIEAHNFSCLERKKGDLQDAIKASYTDKQIGNERLRDYLNRLSSSCGMRYRVHKGETSAPYVSIRPLRKNMAVEKMRLY